MRWGISTTAEALERNILASPALSAADTKRPNKRPKSQPSDLPLVKAACSQKTYGPGPKTTPRHVTPCPYFQLMPQLPFMPFRKCSTASYLTAFANLIIPWCPKRTSQLTDNYSAGRHDTHSAAIICQAAIAHAEDTARQATSTLWCAILLALHCCQQCSAPDCRPRPGWLLAGASTSNQHAQRETIDDCKQVTCSAGSPNRQQ